VSTGVDHDRPDDVTRLHDRVRSLKTPFESRHRKNERARAHNNKTRTSAGGSPTGNDAALSRTFYIKINGCCVYTRATAQTVNRFRGDARIQRQPVVVKLTLNAAPFSANTRLVDSRRISGSVFRRRPVRRSDGTTVWIARFQNLSPERHPRSHYQSLP